MIYELIDKDGRHEWASLYHGRQKGTLFDLVIDPIFYSPGDIALYALYKVWAQ